MSRALRQAVKALADWDPRKARGALKDAGRLRPRETGSYLAWVHGVLRRRRSLGTVLGAVARRALKGRKPETVGTLEVLGYRLLYEDADPERLLRDAATLAPSKRVRSHLEHVIEALAASVIERLEGLHEGEGDVLPTSRTSAVRFAKPLLGVEGRSPAGRLAILHSLPDALVEAWTRDFGEDVARALCWAANDPPPLFGRVQPLRTDLATLQASLAQDGITASATDVPGGFCLGEGRAKFRTTQAWKAGWFSIQDLTAQRAAPLLAPREGERVLDLCAAPGGKTTGLAELSGDAADVLACDVAPRRLRKVEENARRLGLESIRTLVVDGRDPGLLRNEAPFDAILVDAPCSNTGVLRRRREVRWRYRAKALRRLTGEQRALLAAALGLLAPGGRLVYSVCAVEREEGEGIVREALERDPRLILEAEASHFPEPGGGDGGYLALLRIP